MPAVLFEGFPELRGQHGFLFPCLHPIAQDDQADPCDASPSVNRLSSAQRGQIESGIYGMPEMSVGPSADELVVLFESDTGAPILSQVPAGPQSDSDADPGECDARNGNSVGPMDNAMTKNADLPYVGEEQDKAKDFQKEEAGTRRKRFPAKGSARLQRARRPVCAKDDPRTFNDITPNHASSTADLAGTFKLQGVRLLVLFTIDAAIGTIER